ncbi:hypothetical protein E6C27_scaffold271G002500 [Cucumis melo var. makuwa]|uniref:Uncharacterized protein n=1 Tax=Cucumis melo var. makuwa TaxID=1194695 RepID=A0A5A7VKC1_CUCMM|nr:hypothetical protein E6C27_scaffold271G002500 [Cucumis melo var. makuwa]
MPNRRTEFSWGGGGGTLQGGYFIWGGCLLKSNEETKVGHSDPGVPCGRALAQWIKGELRGANPSTRGLGWANLWCTGYYANSSCEQLSWYGRSAAPREILLYTSSRMRFLNITSIGDRCKHREVFSDLVLNESQPIPAIAVSLATSLVAAPYLLIRIPQESSSYL